MDQEKNFETLQNVYNQITSIITRNNVIINITPPRPYLILRDDDKAIKEIEYMLKEGKIKLDEYNKKMDEMNKRKLYFDEAYKFTNFTIKE
jgi:hypothetical protein